MLGVGSDDTDADVILASEEETVAWLEAHEHFLLWVGEFEDVSEHINGGFRLLE